MVSRLLPLLDLGGAVLCNNAVPVGDGILLSTDALSEFPAEPGGAGREMADRHVLSMPAGSRSAGLVTNRRSVDRNPHGHEPTAACVPAGDIADRSGAVVPTMGLHWLDSTDSTCAPDVLGFTEVFLQRGDADQVVFKEPLATKAHLESPQSRDTLSEEALTLAGAEYDLTTYSVRYDAEAGAYRVELGGFARRTAS